MVFERQTENSTDTISDLLALKSDSYLLVSDIKSLIHQYEKEKSISVPQENLNLFDLQLPFTSDRRTTLNFFWKTLTIIVEAINMVSKSETPHLASKRLRINIHKIRHILAANKLSLENVMGFFGIQAQPVTEEFDEVKANSETTEFLKDNLPQRPDPGKDVDTYRNWAVLCGLRDLASKLFKEACNLEI